MKRIGILSILLLFIGCKAKSIEYYQKTFIENKNYYLFIREKVLDLLNTKDSLYKFEIGVTGKRFTETPYINDTTIFRFYGVHLNDQNQTQLAKIMYYLNLENVCVYRDSTKYIFAGMHKDTIAIYNNAIHRTASGHLIDTNTYVFFEKW